jgi:hypothetical protein
MREKGVARVIWLTGASALVALWAAFAWSGTAVRADGVTRNGASARGDGRSIFRYDTFGNEQLWTGVLRMHEAVAATPPAAALSAGLKVDLDALPPPVVDAILRGAVDLNDPAVTITLLKLDAVVGIKGSVDQSGRLASLGVTCALCHSTVDAAVAAGIGHRLDGWANGDLDIGAIVALSPALDDETRTVFRSWGPGRYDPRHHMFDGTNITTLHTPSVPVLIPPIFGLKGVGFETFTADGPISYWNSYVGVTQMGGQGTFSDPRIGVTVAQTPDLVTPKLEALLDYQLSLRTPKAPRGSFNPAAADRGESLFDGRARCSMCHAAPNFTDVLSGRTRSVPFLHEAAEIGIDGTYAERSATGRYRTTPLRALWQARPFFHDGSAPDLRAVVEHYDGLFGLGLTPAEKSDLIEYLKTL